MVVDLRCFTDRERFILSYKLGTDMLSDIWQLSIKVSSWTSSIADISMSDNSRYDDTSYEWMFVMIDMTMDFTIRIDTISNTDSSGKIFESSDLRFGRFMKFKITDE